MIAIVGRDIIAKVALSLIVALLSACSAKDHMGAPAPGAAGTGGGGMGQGGRGGAGGTNPGAAGTGAAVAGTGGATGAAGVTGAGPQSRVLIIDPPTNRFLSYDRDGQPIRDYRAHLDVGAGFGARSIWPEGWVATSWDSSALGGAISSPGAPRGVDEPRAPTVILIRSAADSGNTIKVKVVGASGTLLTTHTLSGKWDGFEISPRRGYLYAQAHDQTAGTQTNAVIRMSDNQVLWQGWAGNAGFARDDRHFVFLPGNVIGLPHVIDLATGVETTSTSTQIPASGGITFGLDAVLDNWGVFRASWNSYGVTYWALDWQGRVTRFASDMPMYVDEYLQGFNATGTKALWSRQSNGSDGQPPSYLGAFELDLATNTAVSWIGSDFSCYGRPAAIAFKIVGSEVQSCPCGGGACTAIATLPAVPDASWIPRLLVSADRRTVVVSYEWQSARIPTGYPEVLCLRAGGEVIARIPWGLVTLDDAGQLLLVRPWVAGPSQIGIVNLATGTLTPLPGGQTSTIIYE